MGDRRSYSLRNLLKADLSRRVKPTFYNAIREYFHPSGSTFQYNVWFRLLQQCKKNKILKYTLGLVIYMIYVHMGRKYGIHANANIEIGPGLFVVHGDGVYLNCNRIGRDFTVYQGVTLGTDIYNSGRVPTVGNNVTIYAGAVVVGKIKVGNNVTIAANSFVNKDVIANTMVAGIPAREKKINKSMKNR